MTNLADKLEALGKAATNGPWEYDGNCAGYIRATGLADQPAIARAYSAADAQLIPLIRNALPEIIAALREREWQPIETVPRELDSSTGCWWVKRCMVWCPTDWGGSSYIAQMDADEWLTEVGEPGVYDHLTVAPTHWRPLPSPPETDHD